MWKGLWCGAWEGARGMSIGAACPECGVVPYVAREREGGIGCVALMGVVYCGGGDAYPVARDTIVVFGLDAAMAMVIRHCASNHVGVGHQLSHMPTTAHACADHGSKPKNRQLQAFNLKYLISALELPKH